jgi:4-amino-4-deoxy-L-arabinose transferase-like glycosyltransferase
MQVDGSPPEGIGRRATICEELATMPPHSHRRSAAPRNRANPSAAPAAWQRALARPHLAVALLAALSVLWTLSPGGHGPGATCDEPYYLLTGKAYVSAWNTLGWRLLTPRNIDRVMGFQQGGPPPHPPLGVWLLGWTQRIFDPEPSDPLVISLVGARFAPALAFGLLIYLIGAFVAQLEGNLAGAAAAMATAAMPRLFGHAHLAALDTFAAVSCFAAVAAASEAVRRGGCWWRVALAGVAWGLAMLIKINGVVVGGSILVWLVWRMGRRSPLRVSVWGLAGVATLLAGWPWLWADPIGRLTAYLGSGVDRVTLHTYYWHQVWADRDVPWHYPWVMFIVTVPLGWLALAVCGVWTRIRRPSQNAEMALITGCIVVQLTLFSIPGVPVYDGVRLFLPVYPLLACLVGAGVRAGANSAWLAGRTARWQFAALMLVFAFQLPGLVACHPFQLSYYNGLVAGLWGAERCGFETTYWGDTVQGPIVGQAAAAAREGSLLLGPNLAPFQPLGIIASQPALADHHVKLVGWDGALSPAELAGRYALVYRRQADLAPLRGILDSAKIIAEVRRQGVWLTRLYRLPESSTANADVTLKAPPLAAGAD